SRLFLFFRLLPPPPRSTLFPYTTLFRSFPLSADRTVAAEQALVFASMCGQTHVVALLLEHGVNVNANPPGSHWTATPLHTAAIRSEEHTSELQSLAYLVCRLLLEKKKKN